MIYRSIIGQLSSGTIDLDCQSHVESLSRVNPSQMMNSVNKDYFLERTPALDSSELILGMFPIENMTLFSQDRDGLSLVRQYCFKLVDNIHVYAQAAYKDRKSLAMRTKISERKNMYSILKKIMPQYCSMLQVKDKQLMSKYGIEDDMTEKQS